MASASTGLRPLLLLLLLLLANCVVADHDSLEISSATPAPYYGGRAPSPLEANSGSFPPSPSSQLPDLSPDLAPRHPESHRTPPFFKHFPSPASPPAPEPGSSTIPKPALDMFQQEDDSDVQLSKNKDESQSDSGSGHMSGLTKAAIIIASVVGASLLVMGLLVYKRRQENIRRARFGYATRNDFL